LLIEVIGINGLLEFRFVPADGNCMIHALNEVYPTLQKDPWKLHLEMVEFAAEGRLHGSMVLNQAQINTLQFQLASNNNSTFDVWAKDIVKKKPYKWCGHMELALFSLMYGVSVTVLTNINDAIDICRGEDLFLFYPGTKDI
jgi:hypothetical protein